MTTSTDPVNPQSVTVELKNMAPTANNTPAAGTPVPPAGGKPHHELNPNLKSFANSQHRASGANIDDSEEVILEKRMSFAYSMGLSTHEAEVRLAKYGRNELPEKHIPKWYIFCSQVLFCFVVSASCCIHFY